MSKPTIAVISFPGMNCEVESLRAIKRAGMEPIYFRWNDDVSLIADCDGYFIPGGFSYEDRGRAGMVAGRDPVLDFVGQQAEAGKVVIGNCNGAQVLVESGLIPLDAGLKMSLARNVSDGTATGFLNEWVWVVPTCGRDRCATSDWTEPMHMPIAHGEGRFTTRDRDLYDELKKNDQLAFSYCDETGTVSEDPIVTPNGSEYAIAGICNPAGNVVALMPHPERTRNGDPYFGSVRRWMEREVESGKWKVENEECHTEHVTSSVVERQSSTFSSLNERQPKPLEIFIETIITNNEERTVEQAARRIVDSLTLKQMKYLAPSGASADAILSDITLFNPNKESAVIRREGKMYRWDPDKKSEEPLSDDICGGAIGLLRRDEPDTGAVALDGKDPNRSLRSDVGQGSETGVCYLCSGIGESDLEKSALLEVFFNPHASTLERMV